MRDYRPNWLESGGVFKAASHDQAVQTILNASGVSTMSYEEAVACYLRARGILRDEAAYMSGPIPEDWVPPASEYAAPTWRVLSSPARSQDGPAEQSVLTREAHLPSKPPAESESQ